MHGVEETVSFSAMKPEIDPKLLADPVFQRVLADSLAIQDRFAAEPVFARTGQGVLKSEGVQPLQKLKAADQKRED